jgi:hypothetical protein
MTQIPYSQLVVSMMHVIVYFQPNCSYTISSLAQHLVNLGVVHWQATKRLLRYIKGTISIDIMYQQNPNGCAL